MKKQPIDIMWVVNKNKNLSKSDKVKDLQHDKISNNLF